MAPERVIGIVLLATATPAIAWAFALIRRTRRQRAFCTSGPFRFVRHPVYVFQQVALAGLVCLLADWMLLVVLPVAAVPMLLSGRSEERRLVAEDARYGDYRRRTAAAIPFVW
jgi:protein-S-isoprenylcysteine O-methyltransferase Ste14